VRRSRGLAWTAVRAAVVVGIGGLACSERPAVPSPSPGAGTATASSSGTAPSSAPALEGLPAAQAEQCASRGGQLYQSLRCYSCHEGVAGHALTGLASRYTLSTLAKYLDAPTAPMPRFQMTDEERRDLSVYLLTTPSTR
jgi:hypothetical protein